ncbi:hypothetical protein ACEPAI_5043 [Sanghuangporus weigelae]
MDDTITTKFRSNAAYLLASQVSPSLAALHAHRATIQSRLPVTLTPLHCPRCTHAPMSTRVVANASKQRTTRRSTTKNGNNNKTQSVQARKSQSSLPRGSRVRVMKSCAACGYVGEEAFERSEDSSSNENNEQASRSAPSGTDLDDALSSPSVPVSRSASATPALVKETETRSNTQQDISIQSSAAKLKAKQAQATTTVARNTGSPLSQTEPPGVSSPSTLPVLQSRSAIKRQKKKTGLQEMLARSKVRKQTEKDHGQDGERLAAFLSAL